MHAGPVLGHGLDHVQENGPLGLVLAPVLEPLLHLLERREGWSWRGWDPGRELRTLAEEAGLAGAVGRGQRGAGRSLVCRHGVHGLPLQRPQRRSLGSRGYDRRTSPGLEGS